MEKYYILKKLICLILVLILILMLSCLTACNFTKKMSDVMEGEAESHPKVEKMMTALAENRISDANALMYPQTVENVDAAISQMIDYLAGREVSSMEMVSINVRTSAGTSGKSREEQLTYQVTLNDGTVIHLNVFYLSNNDKAGFKSFQLMLGVV